MINDLPTIYEVVNGKDKVSTQGNNHSNNKHKSNSKPVSTTIIIMFHCFDNLFACTEIVINIEETLACLNSEVNGMHS